MNDTSRREFLAATTGSVAAIASGATPLAAKADEDTTPNIGSEPQLFLDNWIIQEMRGLRRTLHQPTKKGLIKEADGRNWERGDCYASEGNLVCRDKHGRFHMTYRYIWWDPSVRDLHPSIGEDKAHWFRQAVAYATSDDGIHWHKPKLGLLDGPTGFKTQKEFPYEVPVGVSKENNLGCPIDFACYLHGHGNVHDPERRFLLRVAKREDTHPFAKVTDAQMYYAADWPDFVKDTEWRKRLTPIEGARLPPRGFKAVAGYDHQAQLWLAFAQDHIGNWLKRGGRDIIRQTTPDLVEWRPPELVLPVGRDESREPRDWVEYMFLIAYRVGGRDTGAWLGQLEVFHSDRSDKQYEMPTIANVWRKGTTEIRLVVSRDAGKTWQRVAGKSVWLPHHTEDTGYDRLVFSGLPIEVGDEHWFYYPAWDGDHLSFTRDGKPWYQDRMRVGRTARATLRRDGYVSLDAEDAGSLLTKPLRFSGDQLRVNLAATKGKLRAELQDVSGTVIEGFALSDCELTTGDGLALPVRWRGQPLLKHLAKRTVRVRFELSGASLYGFRFGT